jgi:hypothetical protein
MTRREIEEIKKRLRHASDEDVAKLLSWVATLEYLLNKERANCHRLEERLNDIVVLGE